MHNYNFRVEIESGNGEVFVLETQRVFAVESDTVLFASGLAEGFAMAHDGAVLEMQIKRVNYIKI
jgi:hypothetical protein